MSSFSIRFPWNKSFYRSCPFLHIHLPPSFPSISPPGHKLLPCLHYTDADTSRHVFPSLSWLDLCIHLSVCHLTSCPLLDGALPLTFWKHLVSTEQVSIEVGVWGARSFAASHTSEQRWHGLLMVTVQTQVTSSRDVLEFGWRDTKVRKRRGWGGRMVCFPGDLGGSMVSLGKSCRARHVAKVATLESQAEMHLPVRPCANTTSVAHACSHPRRLVIEF